MVTFVADLYEAEEGSDDPRAIQGGGGPSERFYKRITGSPARIRAYAQAHYNRYGERLIVRMFR